MKARGVHFLRNPHLNKSTAFTQAERDALGLQGLLPESIESQENQAARVLQQLGRKPSDLDKYICLSALQETNEALFYRVVMSDPAGMLPLIYTPTVGDACLEFSRIFERPRGLYLSMKRTGSVREILRNWPERDVRLIVVTSGERTLGLGDLGANGMGIAIGKLALYTACAGVPPTVTMPVLIDYGTNNQTLLQDPLYIGLRQTRCSAAQLDELVEEFVAAVQQEFPDCCIQFEDWARADAFRHLARYRDRICCFNDDIQGTGAVALAGIRNALRITGVSLSRQTFLFLGAGAAAAGISQLLSRALTQDGLTPQRAREQIWLFNRGGLVESTRMTLADFQKPYAHLHAPITGFVNAVESIKPSVIIGVSTVAKAFDQRVIEAMTRINQRPIIMALSNPTSCAECTAEEAYKWSHGRAVFASGSPFSPVRYQDQTLVPGQCNNVYIFPAMGLAVYATRARQVTDEMFLAAAEAVAEQVTTADLESGLIFPPQSAILRTELRTAQRIAEVIFARGLARAKEPEDLSIFIESQLYRPEYSSVI